MKYLLDLAGELKIELAEAAESVGGKVHGHFISRVGPFRMMVHGLRRKRHGSYVTKGVGKFATGECAMQLPAFQTPAFQFGDLRSDFLVVQLLYGHSISPIRLQAPTDPAHVSGISLMTRFVRSLRTQLSRARLLV